MPKFYSHMRIDGVLVMDDEGAEFPDLGAAVDDAKAAARDLIAAQIREDSPSILGNSFEITDGHGELLQIVQFADGLRQDFRAAVASDSSID